MAEMPTTVQTIVQIFGGECNRGGVMGDIMSYVSVEKGKLLLSKSTWVEGTLNTILLCFNVKYHQVSGGEYYFKHFLGGDMYPLIAENQEQLKQLCRRYYVSRLELFGSAAVGTYDPENSDLDFLVEFQPVKVGHRADCYFGLLEELETVFSRPIDLLMTNSIRNPYFLEAISKTRTPLYVA